MYLKSNILFQAELFIYNWSGIKTKKLMEKTEDSILTSVGLWKPSSRLLSTINFLGRSFKNYHGIQIIHGKITVLQGEQNEKLILCMMEVTQFTFQW